MQDIPQSKKNLSSWKSVIIPSILILLLFFVAGYLVIVSLSDFYYRERAKEASLLAKSYTEILSTVIDAEQQLERQMSSTLKVAGATVAMHDGQFTRSHLEALARQLDVDVIYLYSSDLILTHSSDGNYIGWETPPTHPVRDFYESGNIFATEAIRADTVSGVYHKYGYYRFPDGRMVQVGILASNIQQLYSQFEPQYIIDQLGRDAGNILLAYIDPQQRVVAATQHEFAGQLINPKNIGLGTPGQDYVRTSWEGKQYLAMHLPIMIKDRLAGSLVLYYDLAEIDRLIIQLSTIVSLALLFFFMLFAFSLYTVYLKNRRILSLAYHDELTGLPNLRNYHLAMEELRCRYLALAVINPVNFRILNIIYGYDHGDHVLINIARHLEKRSEELGCMQPYRLSDDRFLLLIRDQASLDSLLEMCKDDLNLKQQVGLTSSIGFSIGLVQSISWKHDGPRMLKEALIALNATTPMNPIQVYNTELEEKLVRLDAIEQELKRTIAGERGIINIALQPIYDLRTGKIDSFEALARMKCANLGSISPVEFIDLAEKRQLIIPLGKLIIELACDFLAQLKQHSFEKVSVAVNVSALQLMDASFVQMLQETAIRKKVRLDQLELELTESVFAQDIQFISKQLERVSALDIKVSIDDFGTGYSSLSRLEALNIDYLKLDRSFVETLCETHENGFISDIISLAHHIEKLVIAEGVETIEQEQVLRELECDYVQGYLYRKPIPLEEAMQLLLDEEANHASN